MAKLQATAVPQLKAQIDAVTGDPDGVPGIAFTAVNVRILESFNVCCPPVRPMCTNRYLSFPQKSGDVIFEHASGKLCFGRPEPMKLDSIFWLASCTKMITSIACMQVIERGLLKLDDVELVEKLSPVSVPYPGRRKKPGGRQA